MPGKHHAAKPIKKPNGLLYIIFLTIIFMLMILVLFVVKNLILPFYLYAALFAVVSVVLLIGIRLNENELANPYFKYNKGKYWGMLSVAVLIYMWVLLSLFVFCDINTEKSYDFELLPRAFFIAAGLIAFSSFLYISIIEVLYKVSVGEKENDKVDPFYLFLIVGIAANFIAYIIIRQHILGYNTMMESGTWAKDFTFYFFAVGGASLSVFIMTIQHKTGRILFSGLENLISISTRDDMAVVKKTVRGNIDME